MFHRGNIHSDHCYVLFLPTAAGSPTNLNAVQVNLTSFRVSWAPPATVTRYQVYWGGGEGYDSGNMSAGAEDRTVTITGRTPGLTYNITIVALSDHLPSPTVGAVMLTLGEPHLQEVLYCVVSMVKHFINGKGKFRYKRVTEYFITTCIRKEYFQ